MLTFENDYSRSAHPAILEALSNSADEMFSGYGSDVLTQEAIERIRIAADSPNANIAFLVGGTQINQALIDMLTPAWGGVIAAQSGHIAVHEAGAIETRGHKVLTIPHNQGTISAQSVAHYCEEFYRDANYEHMVFPSTVYISFPTEYGTLYSKQELLELRKVCDQYHMRLIIDGARLGYGLTAAGNDVTLHDLVEVSDAVTIGGTKCGAMFGEAAVFNRSVPEHLVTQIKQHGALLAKGWLLGLQFATLFKNNLYFDIARHANEMADHIRQTLDECGYKQVFANSTNQIFVELSVTQATALAKYVRLGFMEQHSEQSVIMRICTSWSTKQEDTEQLLEILRQNA